MTGMVEIKRDESEEPKVLMSASCYPGSSWTAEELVLVFKKDPPPLRHELPLIILPPREFVVFKHRARDPEQPEIKISIPKVESRNG